jgi:ribosomal protein S4
MRSRLLAWAAGAVLLPLLGAGTATADVAPGTQAVGQTAASQQAADAGATSTQVNPTNQNIAVRVLSPGDDGAVTQSNTSTAAAAAANANAASQAASQAAPAASGTQAVGQSARNSQAASSDATSTQVKPSNQNVSVRVLSPGDDGSVSQSNDSTAESVAANANKTAQEAEQAAGGGGGGGGGGQAVGQAASNDQTADADATSKQVHPSNVNAPVRVLSKGEGGDVEQSNDSTAKSAAVNANKTVQKAAQDQGGWKPDHDGGPKPSCGCEPKQPEPKHAPCGCEDQHSTGVQAIGQEAKSHQEAEADAKSVQVGAKNINAPVRVLSPGDDGDVRQRNNSFAGAIAANKNATGQFAQQAQGDLRPGAVGIQAIGQKAKNDQDAEAEAKSIQIGATNVNAPVRVFSPGGGGDVDQRNASFAGALALNKNATLQDARQEQGGLWYGALGIQAIGQAAFNEQEADADATSLQFKPSNVNAPVRIGDGTGKHKRSHPPDGSPGDAVGDGDQAPAHRDAKGGGDGSVEQANDSAALAAALNGNWTEQLALQV